MKLIFRIGNTLQVISKSTTSNNKIEADKKRKIVQTYTFSRKQFELIANGTNDGMKTFFSNADTNCLDCPFNEFGKCYTHKFNQHVEKHCKRSPNIRKSTDIQVRHDSSS